MSHKETWTTIVKAFAVLIGLIGSGFVLLCAFFVFAQAKSKMPAFLICIFFIPLGSLLIWVSYKVIFRYSKKSLESLLAIYFFFFCAILMHAFEVLIEGWISQYGETISMLSSVLIPLALALIAYHYLLRILVKRTIDEQTS